VSLYREPGRVASRTIAIAAVVTLVAGLAIGYAIGHSGSDGSSLASQLSDLRGRLEPAREGIELAPGEYAQGVSGGRVVSAPEYGGARDAVKRAAQTVASNRSDLRALSVARAAALDRAIEELTTAMEQHVDAARVKRLAAAAGAALRAATGP
jgi:hypothetical protein